MAGDQRAGGDWIAPVHIVGDALHDWQYGDNGTRVTRHECEALAVVALDVLRSLPVEERMEAMGMHAIGPEGNPYYWIEADDA